VSIPHQHFYFVRHGETDWNLNKIYMGSMDIPLNPTGREQAKRVANLLKKEPIAHIVSSPLSRALETAEIIAETMQRPISIHHGFRESNLGILQGRPKSQGQGLIEGWADGKHVEAAETAEQFHLRIKAALNETLEMPAPVLIVAHGGVNFFIQKMLKVPTTNTENCSAYLYLPPRQPSHPWSACYLKGEESS
jgi:broad specificity phosphatase PhoE